MTKVTPRKRASQRPVRAARLVRSPKPASKAKDPTAAAEALAKLNPVRQKIGEGEENLRRRAEWHGRRTSGPGEGTDSTEE